MSSQTILVTGASGLVGRPLCRALRERDHQVLTVSRGNSGDFKWDIDSAEFDASALAGVDVVIHLAGETVAQRWTKEAKARILNSRVRSTRLLVDAILATEKRPALISASGISYYGVDRAEPMDENAVSGSGFLAEVTRQWEGAAQPLLEMGLRTVFMRTGIVLSRHGGALAKMLPPFQLGLGGRVGSGRQWMSWVSLPDLVSMYLFAVENQTLTGAVNAVAPYASSNAEFTKILGKVLGRPTFFPFPAALVKALFGEMGKETVLSNLAILPRKFEEYGFVWRTPNLEQALKETLQ
ncbi:MAG: TIGR01777 family oxidoreductase [Opitutales bacterium]